MKDICTTCLKKTEYILKKEPHTLVVRGKEHTFDVTVAECCECGSMMHIPGIIGQMVKEWNDQYREAEGLVFTSDIETLMKIYNIGKAPLSLALGFGEITITRYLEGVTPSKEYSDIIRKALSSPSFMKESLIKHRDEIANTAFVKAMKAVETLEQFDDLSPQLRSVICRLFENMEEVTPLSLQKLLYFTQGVSYATVDKPLFREDCEAWLHGPVYPAVYSLFRDFRYNPIDDPRYSLFRYAEYELSKEEKQIIDLVTDTFGQYSGKVLEKLTHLEKPWVDARKGYDDSVPSHEPITKEAIRSYYQEVSAGYDLCTAEGLNSYIESLMH